MKTGEFRQDSDSHWYVIPDELLERFDELDDKTSGVEYVDDPHSFDEFERLFGKYRTGGGYTGYKVIIDEV